MDESLHFALHAPILELHAAHLVGAHQGTTAGSLLAQFRPQLLSPVVIQRTTARFGHEQLGVLLPSVVSRRYRVLHDVDKVCEKDRSDTFLLSKQVSIIYLRLLYRGSSMIVNSIGVSK